MMLNKSLTRAEFEACLFAIAGPRQEKKEDNGRRLQALDAYDKTRRIHGRLAAMNELFERAKAVRGNNVVDIAPFLQTAAAKKQISF